MNDFITARRKDDAVISICQDNEQKIVLILGLNQAAKNLLKYKEENLLNKPLIDILSTKAADDINEYLDYTENGHDLLDILPKVIGFSLVDIKGKDIKAKVKVFRTAQSTNNKINYELLIRDISLFHKLEIFRDKYLSLKDKKYKNHDLFGIADNNSTMLELSIILDFAFEYQINVAAGIICLDSNYKTDSALKIIIKCFYKNCRSDDFLGYINDNKVLFILIDCSANDTSKVVSRIHSAINGQLLEQELPSTSIAYANISSKADSSKLVEQLNTALSRAESKSTCFEID